MRNSRLSFLVCLSAIQVVAGALALGQAAPGASAVTTVEPAAVSPAVVAGTRESNELVIVSKMPEFFSIALTIVGVVLTIITFLVGVVFATLVPLVWRLDRESRSVLEDRKRVESLLKEKTDQIEEGYRESLRTLQLTAVGYGKVYQAKLRLRKMFVEKAVQDEELYGELQKTISHPDVECLRFYAKALSLFPKNADIARIVSAGISEYTLNPQIDSGSVCS